MDDILNTSFEIRDVLSELERGNNEESDSDNDETFCVGVQEDEISEHETGTEVDDTDNDPDYNPSDEEGTSTQGRRILTNVRPPLHQVSDSDSDDELPGPERVSHRNIVQLPRTNLRGRNRHKWSAQPSGPSRTRTPARNVIHFTQKPNNEARQISSPLEAFLLFLNDNIQKQILKYTNQEIVFQKSNYKTQNATVKETNLVELKSLIGLLLLSAAHKDNHLNTDELFNPSYSGSRYISVMSKARFEFLINCLRFDDRRTREERCTTDKFAPIRGIFNEFVELCQRYYIPGTYLTIDEQLLAFRGRCAFRMYLPNKPAKYGIKIFMMCDVRTKYLINAIPYTGKTMETDRLPTAMYFVRELSKPVHNSNRNITYDNWFTSVPLATMMLDTYKLTTVGTMRRDKPEIPAVMLQRERPGQSKFCFDGSKVMVTYQAKQSKQVVLLSTTHEKAEINESGKPDIVEFYNATKGAVDTFDEMSCTMSCSRKTRRWPLCIFYGMLNSIIINSFVIYVHQAVSNKIKPMSRREFAKEISDQLTTPQIQERQKLPNLSRNLKRNIEDVIGPSTSQVQNIAEEPRNKKICGFCPAKKRRMTRFQCTKCYKYICLEHRGMLCVDCSK